MSQALAQIQPAQRAVRIAAPARALSRRQKAAVIVKLLVSEGSPIPISALPEDMQADLTEEMGQLRLVDRDTLQAVVAEFLAELDGVGLAFPGGMEGALKAMDGHISSEAAHRLRRAGAGPADPWERLNALPPDKLLPVLEDEAPEVAAVVLSKLPVARAAELLGKLPGQRARRVAFAVSQTGDVDPATVRRIGQTLAHQLEAEPPRAFAAAPGERVGAILNIARSQTRDDVLAGLEAEDAVFSAEVRRSIFTFAHLPERVLPADVPKIVRLVDQPILVTALAGDPVVAAFLLSHLSQRLAQTLQDEITDRPPPREAEAEEAMTAIIESIRRLEAAGGITLSQPPEG
ncbi:FliG C-terminal domain-containing protein [Falsirhodobacter algicola]|uniref:Flagellar motor switch protein FliG n=1 Tax=Falsirhodobacter algicola TaxID=2692330 RepID=A0A8J8MS24_9RHOB|nr:FliG C-terminal domain-containing protein [Falsirhodobacter algicola]QUS35163.1 flagellar motor switch protein FliG [Falsirhodobacter algicola]